MAIKNKLLGLNKVFNNTNKEIKKLKGRTQAGVTTAALFIKGEAQRETPVVEGNLRGSAFVTWPGGINSAPNFKGGQSDKLSSDHAQEVAESTGRVGGVGDPVAEVGFSAVYAVSVHENPRSGKTQGISPLGKRQTAGRTTSGAPSRRKVFSTVGSWKFLENALKNNTKRILEIIRQKARIR